MTPEQLLTFAYVADSGNHRVLVWNVTPSSGGQAADFALGQPASGNLTSQASGTSASSLYTPTGLATDGTSLFVADRDNHRVLVWATLPTAGGAPATSVIGQPSLDAGLSNAGGTVSRDGLDTPSGIYVEPTRLFISDDNNRRILIVPR